MNKTRIELNTARSMANLQNWSSVLLVKTLDHLKNEQAKNNHNAVIPWGIYRIEEILQTRSIDAVA